uniref:RelA/SpoT domain-containing protein n=1 Tax=Rhodosorus marinus TaxID=101924 RepID=A0A7S3E5N7_9RHOD|mmetsp:Transcript_10906/g.45335  ORF Transcript_10906/g.45335 Transcript_10906/m.45335 type:complete len:329 (+) Transcript_10906:856-1842(+)
MRYGWTHSLLRLNIWMMTMRKSCVNTLLKLLRSPEQYAFLKYVPERVASQSFGRLLRRLCFSLFQVLVKLAEVLNTMRNVHELRMYEQHIRALECLQVFVPLAHAMGIGKLMWDLEDISFRVLFPESYAAVEEWHSLMRSRCETTLERSTSTLRRKLMMNGLLKEYTAGFDISGRTKNLFSTFKKVLKGNKKKEEVLDIMGMRVILNVKEEYRHNKEVCSKACLEVHRIITEEWPEMEGRLKDYIGKPKPNGYQSIHTTVIASDGLPLEAQIRTQDMHNAAEYGNAGHQFYKGDLKSVDEVQRFAESLRNENMAMLQLPAAREVVAPA